MRNPGYGWIHGEFVGRADLYQTPKEPDIKLILTDAMNSTAFVSADLQGFQRLFASVPYAVGPPGRCPSRDAAKFAGRVQRTRVP